MLKTNRLAALLMSTLLILAGCGGNNANSDPDNNEGGSVNDAALGAEDNADISVGPAMSFEGEELNFENTIDAVITLEGGDEIRLELYPDIAPETVANFVKLAENGTYEGTIFHRVIKDFMIQGGGYDENLNEVPAETITGEFANNGFPDNNLSHTPGVISMARANDPNSASSQFFIVHASSTHLDGDYAAFGKVKDDESMAVVDKIANVETVVKEAPGYPVPFEALPVDPIIIQSVTIEE